MGRFSARSPRDSWDYLRRDEEFVEISRQQAAALVLRGFDFLASQVAAVGGFDCELKYILPEHRVKAVDALSTSASAAASRAALVSADAEAVYAAAREAGAQAADRQDVPSNPYVGENPELEAAVIMGWQDGVARRSACCA